MLQKHYSIYYKLLTVGNFFFKKLILYTFIQQGCIKLIKCMTIKTLLQEISEITLLFIKESWKEK